MRIATLSERFPSLRWRPEVLVLTALAALTRFAGLFHPDAVVFDELHFEHYSGAYLAHAFYHDVHPPLAKLLLAGAAQLLHVSAATLVNAKPAPVVRLLPALVGTLIVPLFYLFMRQLRGSRRVATLGAFCLVCENALVLQSRLILLDIFLVFFTLLAANLYLAARTRTGRARWIFMAAAAVVAGFAASVKWTGLSALGLIMLAWFVEERPKRRIERRRLIVEGALLVVLPLAAYASTFAVHIKLLPNTGPGALFMPPPFRATLAGDYWYKPSAKMSFIRKFVLINRVMKDSETQLRSATHPYGSKWYTWPIMLRPIHYWTDSYDPKKPARDLYLMGNVVVWWGSLAGMLVLAYLWFRRRPLLLPYRRPLAFLAFGYALNFVPFAGIRRVMFLYHYFNALLFAVALAAFCLGILAGWMGDDDHPWRFPTRGAAAGYWGTLAFVALGFLFFSPLTYGWQISHLMLKLRLWLPTWG